MTCRDLVEGLFAFVEDDLDRGSKDAFEGHLRSCAACRAYRRSYETTVRLLKLAFHPSPSAEVLPEPLVRAILVSRSRSFSSRFH
jgi:anti-sigma factor RsiW